MARWPDSRTDHQQDLHGDSRVWQAGAEADRPVISRPVPAIVTEATWKKAQKTLQANFLFGERSAKNQYLLRGLIKCGLCGLTYVGVAANRPNGKREFYYRCNGAHSPSIYPAPGRCQAKAVRGDHLEQQVWSDVETFLRNPEPVLEQLHARLESDAKGSDQIQETGDAAWRDCSRRRRRSAAGSWACTGAAD